jgi:hypothetical protein
MNCEHNETMMEGNKFVCKCGFIVGGRFNAPEMRGVYAGKYVD